MIKAVIAAAATLIMIGVADAETLRNAVVAAYETNPQLAAARARQEALAETPEQARAGGRLTAEINGEGGYSRFDYVKGGSGSIGATLPITTFGRVASAVRAASADVAAGNETVRDTLAALLELVVKTYADLLYAQQAVLVAKTDIKLLDQQVAEARSRFKLGQATLTDVAQLEAQRESVVATLADAEGATAAITATYRATVGHDPGVLDALPPAPISLPASAEAAQSQALSTNPVVLQQRLNASADVARIAQERAERNPSLALKGTYGYSAGENRSFYNNVAIGGVTLRVPLLTGGLVSSRVRQAESVYRADRFAIDAAEREVIRLVQTSWANLAAAQGRAKANTRRVEAAELALKGVRAEYAFSLRSTLDILIADESLRAAQLALARSQSDVLVEQAGLLRSTGLLGPESY